MQISHIEVRRHPIWQREVRNERHIAGPNGAFSRRGKAVLLTFTGMLGVAIWLVTLG